MGNGPPSIGNLVAFGCWHDENKPEAPKGKARQVS